MITTEIRNLIDNSERIVCVAHQGPDGDAVGSTTALASFLKKIGKKVEVILPNKVPEYLKFIPNTYKVMDADNMLVLSEIEMQKADLIFCLDFNQPHRVGKLEKILVQSKAKKIMIDHHLHPNDFCDITISHPEVSSTCQLVYQFMAEINEELIYSDDIMTSIYTGILTDTGSFRFSSVDAQTHRIAQKFIEHGFKHEKVHREIYDQNKLNRMQLMGYCIHQKLKIDSENKVGILTITSEELKRFNCQKSDTEGFVNMVLSIIGVEIALFIIEQEKESKLSLRSVDNWHVNEIMNEFYAGGGHKNAAGGQFKGTPAQASYHFSTTVIPVIDKFFHE
jgi:phosphoesterase RecJ-like protein